MATEANEFTDILSAALDESGITGDENLDFDLGFPVPDTSGGDAAFQAPVIQEEPRSAPVLVNGHHAGENVPNQGDMFSQALKQLAAAKSVHQPPQQVIQGAPAIGGIPQQALTQHNPPVSVFHRSSSTPTIIKLPASSNPGAIVSQLPQLLRQQSAQVQGAANKAKIITVKRVGADGSVTQSRSFTVGNTNGPKILVRPSGTVVSSASGVVGQPQVLQAPTGQRQFLKLPAQILQGGNSDHPPQVQQVVRTSSPAFNPMNQSGGIPQRVVQPVTRTGSPAYSASGSVLQPNGGLVPSSHSGPNKPHSGIRVHVLQNPRQNVMPDSKIVPITPRTFTTVSPSGFHPSHSVPAHLNSLPSQILQTPVSQFIHNTAGQILQSSIPSHVLHQNNPYRTSPSPPVHVVSPAGLSGGKVLSGSQLPLTTVSNDNQLTTVSSLAAMQRTVNNLPISSASLKTNLTNKDVSRLWSTEDIRLKSLVNHTSSHQHHQQPRVPRIVLEEDEVEEEAEELGQAETYNEYMPTKLKLGLKHPDPVVETSSLASVEPQDIWYKLSIPEGTIDLGELSALQLESIVYACQRHDIILQSGERAGFLIGDGAGVGKGRTIAGIIYENYLLGRKRALWLSVSNDLKVDAERDLRDIGAGKIDVHPLNKFKYAKISSKENGSVKKGVIFATYSSLIGESHSGGKYKTRLKQLLKWFGKDFDGVIVFDECHKAKNLCPVGSSKPTKTGLTVLELQKRLPKARIVYASATGASEPKNMAYMTRLGLWGPGTPFKEFNDFIQAVERRGVGAMELVAMDMKLRGMYIARQLSFKGVSFKIEEIPIDKDFVKVYNECVILWVDAREMFQSAADLIDAEQRMKKSMWGQFWSAHQRFFKYLCISAKVSHCVRMAREAVKTGKCVVIGLQSTGEARTLEQLEESGGELNDFVSTAKGVFQTLVEKHFPAPDRRKTFDIFGLGGSQYEYENSNSPNPSGKRKKDQDYGSSVKKQKTEDSSDSDASNSGSESSDFDLDLSDLSDESSDNDDFNPFANGSDSDDDPWLKKTKNNKREKKEKVSKKKKKKKKKKEKDLDDEFDKALLASGLLNKNRLDSNGLSKNGTVNNASGDAVEKAFRMKKELLDRLEVLGETLPPNTLDQLIDELGGPDNVAEMTGRKGRVVCTDEGISYESRSENDVSLEILNLTEKQRFMDGEKNVAIISEAASSGISLQADRRVVNQRRRVHITLELPWSADRAIQQFGRTHRSNQVHAPEYLFLISELAGEQRFASTVARRLESLGALTHGDRRATESRDLSRFNFDNKFGRTALESVMKSVCGFEGPLVAPPAQYQHNFFEDAMNALIGVGMITKEESIVVPILEKDYNNISKFLNRILGIRVDLQNALFRYFSDSLTAIILEAKKSGRWDMGILDLGSGGESVKKLETQIFVGNTAANTAKTELTNLSVERGMSFPAALDIWKKYTGVEDGFYLSQDRIGRRFAIVAAYQGAYNKKKEKLYTIYRPNTGLQPRQEPLAEIKKKYKKVLPEEAQKYWEDQYIASATVCSHAFWKGNCKKVSFGLQCEIGLRTRTYHVLSGSVLSVWSKVESVLASLPGGVHSKMQIIRLRTDEGQRIVGTLIPSNCVGALTDVLSKDCSKTYTEKHTENVRPKPQEESEAVNTLSMPVFF